MFSKNFESTSREEPLGSASRHTTHSLMMEHAGEREIGCHASSIGSIRESVPGGYNRGLAIQRH